jgi:hypothetical protein
MIGVVEKKVANGLKIEFDVIVDRSEVSQKVVEEASGMNGRMPPALMARFLEGVTESAEVDRAWETTLDPRPSRLALGGDPRSLSKSRQRTDVDGKLKTMTKHSSDSDSDHGYSRGHVGPS